MTVAAHAAPPAAPPVAVAVAVFGNGVAGLLLLTAWYAGSSEARADDVALWLNLSAVGLSLALAADAVLLTSLRARVGRRHRELAVRRRARLSALPAVGVRAEAAQDQLVGLRGSALSHAPVCALVTDKPVLRLSAAQLRQRRPCGWCDGGAP